MTKTLNPGSDEAVKLGCICPIVDNAHGKGYIPATATEPAGFIISLGCPVHDPEPQEKTNEG